MKREAFRRHTGFVLVLAVLLAFGAPAAVAFGGDQGPDVTPLIQERLFQSAATEEDGAPAKHFPEDALSIGSADSQHAAFTYEPLPAMPVVGTLDSTHPDDYYSWKLAAGQTAYLSLTGDVGTDFDIGLYGPDGTLLLTSVRTTYPDGIAFTLTGSGAGTFYVRVARYSGDGEYALTYGVDTDSHRPGTRLLLPGAPVYGMLDCRTDFLDCFNVYAFAGQTLSGTLDYALGTDFDLMLTDSNGNTLADTFSQVGTRKYLSYKAPTSATYYLFAFARSGASGSGWYNLSYSRAVKAGRFRPVLYTSSSKLRVGRTVKYWGAAYPNCFARYRMVQVQKLSKGHWVHARWVKLDRNGRFPAVRASYSRRTTQYIRLYMPAYVDKVRGINYKHAYSAARRVRWY